MPAIYALIILTTVVLILPANADAFEGHPSPLPDPLLIEVTATHLREGIVLPANPLLQDVSGLSLRTQGSGAPQSDLSLRGAPFNSVGLLLSGLSLRNPQSEHWHADIPMAVEWFKPPTILTGLERFRVSDGHPSGSVALELTPLTDNYRSLTTGAGNKNTLFGKALATQTSQLESGATAAASGALSIDRTSQSDGQRDNHLERATAAARLNLTSETRQGDLLTAISWREFGARGFYGANPNYPALERKSDAMVVGSLQSLDDLPNPFRMTTLWQRTKDIYWLDRHNHALFENKHTSDFLALHGEKHHTFSHALSLDLRLDNDLETIDSNSLGDHTRSHLSLAALPNLCTGPLIYTLGGALDLFSSDSPVLLPATGVEWKLTDTHSFFLNYTSATRQPSYTELNYNSPDSLGNSGLKRQRSHTEELGWRGKAEKYQWRTTIFHEDSRNTVDWILRSAGERWESVNLRKISAWGWQSGARFACGATTDIASDLLLLTKRCRSDYHASRYAMDYPELEAGITVRQKISDKLRLKLHQGAGKYAANRARANSDWQALTNTEAEWQPPFAHYATITAGINNLFSEDFQTYPGQEPATRRYYLALSCTW